MIRKMSTWMRAASASLGSLALWAGIALAQATTDPNASTTTGSVTTTTTSEVWYGNWWVWAIGVAVFLIIVIALTNRGSSSSSTR